MASDFRSAGLSDGSKERPKDQYIMAQVTFTVAARFRDEVHDRIIVASEDDTASKLVRHLSKYMYGGIPVYLTNGREIIKGDEPLKSFKEEKLECIPIQF